jgi:hypothetical protein
MNSGGGATNKARQAVNQPSERKGQQRHDDEHPADDDAAGGRTQLGHSRIGGSPGKQAAQHWSYPGEQVRHAGNVGQHEVPVEADDRNELLEHLEVQEQHHQHEQSATVSEGEAVEDEQAPNVQIQPAEVGAETTAPIEAVGVSDVGIERGEDEINTDPDHAWLCPAVSARGGVAQLVYECAEQQDAGDHQQRHRRRERLIQRAA